MPKLIAHESSFTRAPFFSRSIGRSLDRCGRSPGAVWSRPELRWERSGRGRVARFGYMCECRTRLGGVRPSFKLTGGAWRGRRSLAGSGAWRGQTEFQVNLKLGLTPRSDGPRGPMTPRSEVHPDPEVHPTPRSTRPRGPPGPRGPMDPEVHPEPATGQAGVITQSCP